jgi:hypothetical protein
VPQNEGRQVLPLLPPSSSPPPSSALLQPNINSSCASKRRRASPPSLPCAARATAVPKKIPRNLSILKLESI